MYQMATFDLFTGVWYFKLLMIRTKLYSLSHSLNFRLQISVSGLKISYLGVRLRADCCRADSVNKCLSHW